MALSESPIVEFLKNACNTTALQSTEIASDTILIGKAKEMSLDDPWEVCSYEFGYMKATSNTKLAMRPKPTEVSKRMTTHAGVRPLISPTELPSLIILRRPCCASYVFSHAENSQTTS